MSQTSYQQDPNPALEGQLVDVSFSKDVITGIANEAITFGRFVIRAAAGAADDRPPRVGLPTTTGAVTGPLLIGVALSDVSLETTTVGWAIDASVRIMRKGRVWMVTEDACIFGAPVFVRFAVGAGGTALGGVRTDADTATAVALPGASFRGIAGAGALVPVEFNPQN